METCSWQPFHLVGKYFQLGIYHAFLIYSQFSSALYSSPVECTAEYIFFQSCVLTRVAAITRWNSFQITDKTTNSPEEQAVVSQGKLKKPQSFTTYIQPILYGDFIPLNTGGIVLPIFQTLPLEMGCCKTCI